MYAMYTPALYYFFLDTELYVFPLCSDPRIFFETGFGFWKEQSETELRGIPDRERLYNYWDYMNQVLSQIAPSVLLFGGDQSVCGWYNVALKLNYT